MKKEESYYTGFITILLLSIIPWGLFLIYFHTQSISKNSNDWADFGSFIGGTVAALTVPYTFYMLIKTYRSQKEVELISKMTLRNQKFETRLFELIKVFNEYRFNQLKGWTQEGEKGKEHYIGLTFFTQKRRSFQILNQSHTFNEAISKVIESANLNFEFYFRSLENILITLDEINGESLEEKNKLILMLINTLTNDEKFFVKYFQCYQKFNHFDYLKKYQDQFTEKMLFDYRISES